MRHLPVPAKGSSSLQSGASQALIVAGLVACTTAPTARFRGVQAPPAIGADDLEQHAYVPHDHLAIGTVAVQCQHDTGASRQDDPCSELALLRAMREVAAGSGATAFVAPSCQYESLSPSLERIRCKATVARRRSLLPSSAKAANASAAQERRWDVRIDGRTIRVTARPGPGVVPTPHAGVVRRVWAVEPGAKKRGTVQAACVERCDRGLAERGLERGAAWIGSEELAEVRCHELQPGRWSCTGDAVSPR